MAHPMGEARKTPLRVNFDRRLKLEFHGCNVTSDAGLLPYRELDDVLGLTELAGAVLSDMRRGKNTRHLLMGLLRQSVFGGLAGYEDVNDAERLSQDPVKRAVAHSKYRDPMADSTNPKGAPGGTLWDLDLPHGLEDHHTLPQQLEATAVDP